MRPEQRGNEPDVERDVAGWKDWDTRNHAVGVAQATLVEKGVVVPLDLGGVDEEDWADCDLASFAENRLGDPRDPYPLDERTRRLWQHRALVAHQPLAKPEERPSEACYWVPHDGRRAGTLALARFCLGELVGAYSVYLRPRNRGKGIMAETLRAVCAELEARGLGLRLETNWTWQPAVRFYLRAGFWLRSWKRDLAFVRPPRAPSPVITIGQDEATVAATVDGLPTVLARARRNGDRLLQHGEEPGLPDAARRLAHDAQTTLALAIALEEWPLIRSELDWQQRRHSDLVHPEALADRIQSWEAWAHEHGWRVVTPRIPGLRDSRSWG